MGRFHGNLFRHEFLKLCISFGKEEWKNFVVVAVVDVVVNVAVDVVVIVAVDVVVVDEVLV